MNEEFAETFEKIIQFEESIRKQQEKYKTHLLKHVFRARLGSLIIAPIIYGMVIPIAFLDLTVLFYQ